MTNSNQSDKSLAGKAFADVVIYAPSELANQISDLIKKSSLADQANVSIRGGYAPPAPGTYSK